MVDQVPIRGAIMDAWESLCARVETRRDLDFDHEFTLQFHLAWEIARIFSFSDELNIRFEVPCGRDPNGEVIRLDLLMWTNPEDKVAVELKAPVRSESGMNSAMTQFRMLFYRDLNRLRHLTESRINGITLGCFLAVVNEKGYLLERRQRVNLPYRTYHGVRVPPGTVIPAVPGANGYPYEMKMPLHEISWKWKCESLGVDVQLMKGMRHYWLNPIFIETR